LALEQKTVTKKGLMMHRIWLPVCEDNLKLLGCIGTKDRTEVIRSEHAVMLKPAYGHFTECQLKLVLCQRVILIVPQDGVTLE